MADQAHVDMIKQGVDAWNQWRKEFSGWPDLSGANLAGIYLTGANLTGVDFSGANLDKASLTKTDMNGAILRGASFKNAWFDGGVYFGTGADLTNADLSEAHFKEANLRSTNLSGSKFFKADFSEADLRGANLSNGDFREARFVNADLIDADLSNSNLTGADLSHANLVRANVQDAVIDRCNVYGASVWDLKGKFKGQNDLVLISDNELVSNNITTNNIKDAQFINLILDNPEIRGVMNTLTDKAVLILGRFTDKDPVIKQERQDVLSTLKAGLRANRLLPIVFDFDRPDDKDFTEMVKTLAGMCYFVIADVTNPKSSPLELQATVPDYQIPFLPIIKMDLEKKDDKGKYIDDGPFAMMQNLQTKYPWVLDAVAYKDVEQLRRIVVKGLIDRAAKKHAELRELKKYRPAVVDAKIFE